MKSLECVDSAHIYKTESSWYKSKTPHVHVEDSILVSNKGGRVITENDRWFLIPAHKIFSIFFLKKGSCDFHGIFGKALKYAFGQVSTRSVN